VGDRTSPGQGDLGSCRRSPAELLEVTRPTLPFRGGTIKKSFVVDSSDEAYIDIERDHFIDVAPTGGPPTLGDMFLGSEDLYRDGHKVGFSGIVCTAVRTQHPPAAFECVITAHLPGGDVTVQGFSFDQPTNTFAITGGTKRWRNAGGQVVARQVNETTTKVTAYISDLG
jgi:hypothetical protein